MTTVEADAPDYVLQRINHAIFQNVEMLQSNIEAVTGHIRKKLEEKGEADVERKVLHFIPTAEGKTYWYDGENYWRIMTFYSPCQDLRDGEPRIFLLCGNCLR